MTRISYKDSGVEIEEANRFIESIRPAAERTHRHEVLGGIGGFAGLFALPPGRFRAPVLVSSADGVGTKVKLALDLGRHRSIGIDLVAMTANDIVTVGAEPLFFLDYFSTGKLDAEVGKEVIEGIADGCTEAGCALLGGETAEIPGSYSKGEYDLAGFSVGVVERSAIVDGSKTTPGDAVIGLWSSGLHGNGYSLARKAIETKSIDLMAPREDLLGSSVGDALLEPTRIYVRSIHSLLAEVPIRLLAHIAGGGLAGNLIRRLPEQVGVILEPTSWEPPPIFELLSRDCISQQEQYAAFNMGIGMVVIVPTEDVDRSLNLLRAAGEKATLIGEVVKRTSGARVQIHGVLEDVAS